MNNPSNSRVERGITALHTLLIAENYSRLFKILPSDSKFLIKKMCASFHSIVDRKICLNKRNNYVKQIKATFNVFD